MYWIEKRFYSLLNQHELDFDALWSMDLDWFETPNHRRGGWSGVCRWTLEGMDFFIKKQFHHIRRTWSSPWGEPTFRNEARQLLDLQKAAIPCPELVYYAENQGRVILINRALQAYQPLDQIWSELDRVIQYRAVQHLAQVLNRLHALGKVHNALYAKHIFVNGQSGQIALLDFEKMKKRSPRKAAIRDLDSLNRHTPFISLPIKYRFMLLYAQNKISARHLIKQLQRKAAKKRYSSMVNSI